MKQKKKEPGYYMHLPSGMILTKEQALKLRDQGKVKIAGETDKEAKK